MLGQDSRNISLLQGLIQIEMLKTIEQMTGKSISDLFDWVVGTSTGGILALGMIYGRWVRLCIISMLPDFMS